MHQEIFQQLVIQQVLREAGAIIEAKDLMDARVTEISVDEDILSSSQYKGLLTLG
jgi:hypothetical protein